MKTLVRIEPHVSEITVEPSDSGDVWLHWAIKGGAVYRFVPPATARALAAALTAAADAAESTTTTKEGSPQ